MERHFSGKRSEVTFDGKKAGKLGTELNPATARVQTEERLKEVSAVFEEHGWSYHVELDPDSPEDTVDLDVLLHPAKPRVAEEKIARNEPCPCGSGKKYKRCCGA